MKGHLINMLITIFVLTFTNIVWAQTYNSTPSTTGSQPTTTTGTQSTTTGTPTTTNQKGMWTCKTNASYAASGSMEEKADYEMANNPKNDADAAFSFALQHCRDCTKITCTMTK